MQHTKVPQRMPVFRFQNLVFRIQNIVFRFQNPVFRFQNLVFRFQNLVFRKLNLVFYLKNLKLWHLIWHLIASYLNSYWSPDNLLSFRDFSTYSYIMTTCFNLPHIIAGILKLPQFISLYPRLRAKFKKSTYCIPELSDVLWQVPEGLIRLTWKLDMHILKT